MAFPPEAAFTINATALIGDVLSPPPLPSRLATTALVVTWFASEWRQFRTHFKSGPSGGSAWLRRWLWWITLHSLLSTMVTPLARLELGKWVGTSPIMYMNAVRSPIYTEKMHSPVRGFVTVVDMYPSDAEKMGMDLFFGCHAFFAMLWLIVGYVQMVAETPRHKAFAKLATLSFALHIVASLAILAHDAPRHVPLNKGKLLEVTVSSTVCFVRGVWHATRGRPREHRQWMVACFILSIEGAGTIRSVNLYMEAVNSMLSYRLRRRLTMSPAACAYVARTTQWGLQCAAPNFVRSVLTRALSCAHLLCYWRWERSAGTEAKPRSHHRSEPTLASAASWGKLE